MEEIRDPDLRAIITKVRNRTGIDLGQYKDSYIARRLLTRMKMLGSANYRQYSAALDMTAGEYEKVVDAFTINVSEFFRDRETWRTVKETVLPAVIAEKKASGRKNLRIWSSACACGEEIYTISMILNDLLGSEYDQFTIRLFASDIDDACMQRAKDGIYDPTSMKNVDKKYLERFTKPTPDGKIAVNDAIKRNVTFRHFDLINGGSMGAYFDLIFCRNVMIYFSEQQKSKLITAFCNALNTGGYLIIGKTETLTGDTRTLFNTINGIERVYQKPVRSLV